ncbi:MAG: hypothetical protein EBU90_21040 [Proteobacteria bacterium]|jgi:hypothetical protein|nr:hypothetical protein [Pseudomonadota bacterium]NBP15402.1 hypothetical protein [bacterium]
MKNETEFAEATYGQDGQEFLSQEEISARKEEMLAFYKEQIEFMTTQLEFEKLTADIEEQRLRRLVAMVRQAQIQNPPEQSEDAEQTSSPEKKRTLKKS